MNKIKYRVWNKEVNESKTNVFLSDDGLNLLYFEESKIFALPLLNSTFVVEQYSMFDDKDGKGIFENDIVRIKYHYADGTDDIEEMYKPVLFKNGSFCFGDVAISEYKQRPFSVIEVVGNIHQNQELLN